MGPAQRISTNLVKNPLAILRRIDIWIIVNVDDMLFMTQTIEGLNMAKDTWIFILHPLGFIIILKKSVLSATQKLEFLGLEIGSVNIDLWSWLSQCSWPSLFANGKSKKFNSKIDTKSQTKVMGNYKLDRFILFNSTSCDTSILTNKISATTTSGIYKKAISLPLNSSSESKFNSWSSMVDKKPRNIKWKVNFVIHKQS